jgi:hypothetical protein
MTKRKSSGVPWVVAGGKPGELGHCQRCGEGLEMNLPQPISVVAAASKAFGAFHARCLDTGRVEPKPHDLGEWLRGRDTGLSSKTIWSVMTGMPVSCDPSIPRDPSDFGRCYRLLKLFPSWRANLYLVAEKHPDWAQLVAAWDKLTEMYEQALVIDDGRKMYEFMKELRK